MQKQKTYTPNKDLYITIDGESIKFREEKPKKGFVLGGPKDYILIDDNNKVQAQFSDPKQCIELVKKLLEFKSNNELFPKDERDNLEEKIKINKKAEEILENEKQSLENQIKELKSKKNSSYIGVVQNAINDLLNSNNNIADIEDKITEKQVQESRLESEMKKNIEGISGHEELLKIAISQYGTHEELKTKISEQSQSKPNLENDIQPYKEEIEIINNDIQKIKDTRANIGTELDKLRIESKRLEEIKGEKDKIEAEINTSLASLVMISKASEDKKAVSAHVLKTQELNEGLNKKLYEDKFKNIENNIQTNDKNIKEKETEIEDLKIKIQAKVEKKQLLEKNIKDSESKVKEFELSIKNLEIQENNLTNLENQIKELNAKLEDARVKSETVKRDLALLQQELEIRKLEQQAKNLDTEKKDLETKIEADEKTLLEQKRLAKLENTDPESLALAVMQCAFKDMKNQKSRLGESPWCKFFNELCKGKDAITTIKIVQDLKKSDSDKGADYYMQLEKLNPVHKVFLQLYDIFISWIPFVSESTKLRDDRITAWVKETAQPELKNKIEKAVGVSLSECGSLITGVRNKENMPFTEKLNSGAEKNIGM